MLMIKSVNEAVKRIYINKDYRFFIMQCQKKVEFIDELIKTLNGKYKKVKITELADDPSIEIRFEVCDYSKNDFEVHYTSILSVNKIVDVFTLQHEFSVSNLDPNGMDSVLDGFGDQSYCMLQYDLEDRINDYLSSKNYARLNYADLQEVIPELKMPENCSMFGSQMTVENAIFRDSWNLC